MMANTERNIKPQKLRPTRTRDKKMKKERRYGVNHVISEEQAKFVNAAAAVMAMQAIQMLFALQGYLATSSINLEHGKVELTIHFEGQPFPTLPQGYKYTTKEVTSHYYWSDADNQQSRVRCVEYTFKY